MADGSRLFLQGRAQVGVSRPTAERMWLLCGLGFLAAAQSAVGDFGASVYAALAALVAALLAELFVTYREHGLRKVRDGSAAASAMALALMLPSHIHPMHAALGAVFAALVAKRSFGGLGASWMNPAVSGWLFVRFSWPAAFGPAAGAYAGYPGAAGSAADEAVRGFLNGTILGLFGAELPAGYIDIFWLDAPGIIADRAALSLLLLGAALFAFRASRWQASAAYLAVFALLARLLGALPEGGRLWEGNALLALLSGGTLLTAFVLVAEPSGSAKSMPGAVAAAALAAALSALFRFYGGELYGGFFAMALVCAVMPLLRRLERRLLYAPARAPAPPWAAPPPAGGPAGGIGANPSGASGGDGLSVGANAAGAGLSGGGPAGGIGANPSGGAGGDGLSVGANAAGPVLSSGGPAGGIGANPSGAAGGAGLAGGAGEAGLGEGRHG